MTLDTLSEAIRKVMPLVVIEMNEQRIPMLEQAWGRSFKEEMKNEDQVTVEIAKAYARPLNNSFYRYVKREIPEFEEHTTNGSDYKLGEILLEDKNSFSEAGSWVGNGFDKTPIHILKKFKVDQNGRIEKCFVMVVDLSKTISAWDEKNGKQRVGLKFYNEDLANMKIAVGKIKPGRKWAKPILTTMG